MMRGITVTKQTTVELITETCYSCGTLFGLSAEFHEHRLADKGNWYCPNGHVQHYTGKSDAEKLKEAERLRASAEEEARIQAARANTEAERARAADAEAKRLRKRATAGVCPCCNRSFVQLSRHMATKHPEVTP